jgi:hypothetical protein
MTNSHLRRKPHTNHLLVVTADGKKNQLGGFWLTLTNAKNKVLELPK